MFKKILTVDNVTVGLSNMVTNLRNVAELQEAEMHKQNDLVNKAVEKSELAATEVNKAHKIADKIEELLK